MKKKLHYKIFISLIVFLFIMSSLPLHAEEKKVIKVGYPSTQGLSMKDDDNNYYGYDYDYLMQIAQYTGWEYEFVEVEGSADEQITELMAMLERGEIDLLGDTRYLDALTATYDYANEPYGSSYNILAVKNDSDLIDASSLIAEDTLRIGVLKSATTRKALLEQFAQSSGITYELVECDSEAEYIEKYDHHEVDVVLTTDLSFLDGFHSIANFSPSPFYFITTKGNTNIISELNQALVNINKINPTLSSTLYNRYFGNKNNEFILNTAEKAFIEKHTDINVLICSGASPIRYGVGKDVLNELSKQTGITFHYTFAKNFEDCKKKAISDDFDIVVGLPYEVALSDSMDLRMSAPYLSSNALLVTNKDVSPVDLEDKKQALTPYDITPYDSNKNLYYYETMEDILNAIDNEEVDYAYLNNYMYTYYMNKNGYQNLTYFNTEEYLQIQYVFGITQEEDLALLSLVNKAIRTQKDEIDNYIYKNAYVQKEFSLSAFIFEHILMISCILLLLVCAILYYIRSRYQKQLQMKKAVELENKRYQLLSDLSGEVSFTYDYANDTMKISAIGIGKLSDQEVIENFTSAVQDTELYPAIMRVIATYVIQGRDTTSEVETCLLHRTENWYRLFIKVIEDVRNNKTTTIYAVGKVMDIQKEKEERERLRIMSETDILTGTRNRGAAQDAITNLLANKQGLGALLMLDLDNFKDVNDTYGHLEGDQVLIETAKMLNELFVGEIVARLGGDEFVVYLSNTTKQEVCALCQKTLSQVQQLPCMKTHNVMLSMSIGVAFTTSSKDFVTLLMYADQMLYEVKRNGRNNFMMYEKS